MLHPQNDPNLTPLQREQANTAPILLEVIEGKQATITYLAKVYAMGYRLEHWAITPNEEEGFSPGSKDRFTLFLAHSKILKMQEDALK